MEFYMKKVKIVAVFGTRPEAIKMCPLVTELRKRRELEIRVLTTGQHKDMLDSVLSVFGVQADLALTLERETGSLAEISARLLDGVYEALEIEMPDIALVHGDTATALAAAIAAFYLKIPVGHIEAGLRTNELYSPFPEEFNRRVISLIARWHFAPTATAKDNLMHEGVDPCRIFVTGNTVIDALRTTVREDYSHPLIERSEGTRRILLTAHRRESIGEKMREIFRAVRRISEDFCDVNILYPTHPNPEVCALAESELSGCRRIVMTPPLELVEFHNIMARSHLILTDSGGIQEEASALGIPTLVLRDFTERQEGVLTGALRLCGTEPERIYESAKHLLSDREEYERMKNAANPFGDGSAARRIADILCDSTARQAISFA